MDKTGEAFDQERYLEARRLCMQGTDEIIKKVRPGMSESDGQELVKQVFKDLGVTKHWHATKFRIGSDTRKNFREPTDVGILTELGDVCFVDVGPVFHDHEADFGRTFVVGAEGNGSEQERLIRASEDIFDQTAGYWKQTRVSGLDLFRFASKKAEALGYELNPKMAGHRLGDFPHQVYAQKETLFDLARVPIPDLWVLEIHLLDHRLQRGAFYEDILRA
ncbi:MAG: M24 family metallopeptidase [Bdellovibrionales bacterium]|nr:M24 family metallopeptidase [Bdellovibrionales bacterium]